MSATSPAEVVDLASTPRAGPRPVLRSRMLATSAIGAALLIASTWFLSESNAGSGPLRSADGVSLTTLNMHVGDVATWGTLEVANTTSAPVTLESLRLVEGTTGARHAVTVEAVQVVEVGNLHGSGIGLVTGDGDSYVAPAVRHPMAGYVLPPGRAVALLVRFQAAKQGKWRLDFDDVAYQTGGQRFTLRIPEALGVCADSGSTCDVGSPPGL